jgi:sugar-specific transcriptional regulator TrmB
MNNFSAAGLNVTETKCYKALLEKVSWLPSELAESTQETRTNIYKVLDRLCELKLAERLEGTKKLQYRANHPTRLLELARENRLEHQRAEESLELRTQELTKEYLKVHEQPGIRHYQGEAEITDIFKDMANAESTVSFIHTTAGQDFYGFEVMHNLRMLAVNSGVHRQALTPDTAAATIDYKETDPKVLLERTWLKADDYTAPVEWGVFDNKLYIISYGAEAMGMVIESKQIATAFTQLFRLLERGQTLLPDYATLPQQAKKHGVFDPEL